MSEVIQPAAGQTVITTDHNDRHRHHGDDHHNRFDAVEARADFRSLTNEVERFGTLNGDRVKDGFSIAGDRINAVGSAVQAGFGGVHDRLCDAKSGIVSGLGTGFAASALASCKTDDGVQAVGKDAVTLAKDNLIAMNVGFSAVNTQAAAIGSAAQVLATAFAGQARDQATMYANASTVQVERTRAELESKIDAGFAAQALALCKCCGDQAMQAAQNFAALQLQASENTCKIEASIIREGSAGRELQRDIYTRQLERVLASIPRGTAVTVPVGA